MRNTGEILLTGLYMTGAHSEQQRMQEAAGLERAGQSLEAEAIYQSIVDANADFHPAWQALGLLAFNAGKLELAANLMERAAEAGPNVALYHRNLCEIYRRLGNLAAAVASGQRAVELHPNDPDSHYNLGIAFSDAGNFGESLASYDRALELRPEFFSALFNRGFVLQDLDRLEEARDSFASALKLQPQAAQARFNLGLAQLALGDWENGWANYEARWTGSSEAQDGQFKRPGYQLPQWHGESGTRNKRLMVITEQGFGDVFQFCRYLNLAADHFAKVGFLCSMPTLRVMEWAFGDRITLFTHASTRPEGFDLQCPLMSLPHAFATRPDTVPADVPYLRVPARASAHWLERLEQVARHKLRVGIAWYGRRSNLSDSRRSLRFDQIAPLLQANRDITWVSLQRRNPGEQAPAVPEGVDWIDWSDELGDFGATAGLVSALDLVISVDSAPVHLAGGLNRPVWMLNRFDSEWRWGRHRAESPWYPSLRIFNQPSFGDWLTVIDKLGNALADLATVPEYRPAGVD